MASGDNTLGKAERLSGKKSVATLLAGGRWGSLGHFRYCWMVRTDGGAAAEGPCPSSQKNAPGLPEVHCLSSQKNAHQGRALPADLSASGVLPEDGVNAGDLPGRILVSVPKRFFKRAVKRNLLKRRIREAYRIQKLPGADIMFQYNSAELADFAAVRADVTAILSRIQAAMASVTSAGRKTPENLPGQGETTSAGRKTPENLPEHGKTASAGRKTPENRQEK